VRCAAAGRRAAAEVDRELRAQTQLPGFSSGCRLVATAN
jgi:hypothetical protein